jgi:hypothetical protein
VHWCVCVLCVQGSGRGTLCVLTVGNGREVSTNELNTPLPASQIAILPPYEIH